MIDVLERIEVLRKQRDWTEYQLAERSGLTQSTISSWYRKRVLPTLPSLERICAAFGITLSQFFDDDTNEFMVINQKQRQLLEYTIKLDSEQIGALINFLEKI